MKISFRACKFFPSTMLRPRPHLFHSRWTTPSEAPHPSETSQSSAPARSHWALHNSSRKRDEWRRCLTVRSPARPAPAPTPPPHCNYQVRKCRELHTGSQKQTLWTLVALAVAGVLQSSSSPRPIFLQDMESPMVTPLLANHRLLQPWEESGNITTSRLQPARSRSNQGNT